MTHGDVLNVEEASSLFVSAPMVQERGWKPRLQSALNGYLTATKENGDVKVVK